MLAMGMPRQVERAASHGDGTQKSCSAQYPGADQVPESRHASDALPCRSNANAHVKLHTEPARSPSLHSSSIACSGTGGGHVQSARRERERLY